MRDYTATALVHATDLTYRQVDYWTRAGVLVPYVAANGSGSQRRYDETEMRVAVVLSVLRDLGCPLTEIAAGVAVQLRREGVPASGMLLVTAEGEVTRERRSGAGWFVDLDELTFDDDDVEPAREEAMSA